MGRGQTRIRRIFADFSKQFKINPLQSVQSAFVRVPFLRLSIFFRFFKRSLSVFAGEMNFISRKDAETQRKAFNFLK
jgi:hypothetical protein